MANPQSMRRYWVWATLFSLVVATSGCVNRPSSEQDVLGALPAQYDATFACADCAGIDYQLTLGDNNRYVIRQHYQTEPSVSDLIETGRWHIDNHGQRLSLVPADTDYTARSSWQIANRDTLVALDEQSDPARVLSDYQLTRQNIVDDHSLAGTRWVLANPPDETSTRRAYIEFDENASRLHGFTGCNRLAAVYRRDHDQLNIERLTSTRRACPEHMDTEQSLTAALNQTSSFRVLGPYLLLFGTASAPAPLAVFQAGD